MIETALNILLIVGYVAFCCYIGYKILIFLIDKTFILIKKSKWFRVFVGLFGSMICVVFGVLKLGDYCSGKEPGKSLFIAIVVLINSLFLLYCTFRAYRDKRGEIEELE